MNCAEKNSACPGIPTQHVALVTVEKTFFRDRPLRVCNAAGREINSPIKFPEEGLYIMCNNTAVQVAAAACKEKACYTKGVCTCVNDNMRANQCFNRELFMSFYQTSSMEPTCGHNSSKNPNMSKPCQGCLSRWLDLGSIPQTVQLFGFNMLTTPMTLHRSLFFSNITMTYDEDNSMEGTLDSFRVMDDVSDLPVCPTHVLAWILHSWHRFIKNCSCTTTQSLFTMFPSQSLSSLTASISTDRSTETPSLSPPTDANPTDLSPVNTNTYQSHEENSMSMLIDEYAMDDVMEDIDSLLVGVNDDVDHDADSENDDSSSDNNDSSSTNNITHNQHILSEGEFTRAFLSQQFRGILQDEIESESDFSDVEDENGE